MNKLLELLKLYLKKAFSDWHSAIVSTLLPLIIAGIGLFYIGLKKLWLYCKILLLSPTPLWVTIILVLALLAYTYLKIKKLKSYYIPLQHKTKYYEVDKYKWETKIFQDKTFKIEFPPICLKHNLLLKKGFFSYYCPDKSCNSEIYPFFISFVYQTARSYIDREIRKEKSL